MLDHVTYHVPAGALNGDAVKMFMSALDFREIPPDDPFEHGWKVRWFAPTARFGRTSTNVHLVETDDGEQDILMLGHFCVVLTERRKLALAQSSWCERDSGSGRIWLAYANLRVEVRSA